jgi:hypothetical protein
MTLTTAGSGAAPAPEMMQKVGETPCWCSDRIWAAVIPPLSTIFRLGSKPRPAFHFPSCLWEPSIILLSELQYDSGLNLLLPTRIRPSTLGYPERKYLCSVLSLPRSLGSGSGFGIVKHMVVPWLMGPSARLNWTVERSSSMSVAFAHSGSPCSFPSGVREIWTRNTTSVGGVTREATYLRPSCCSDVVASLWLYFARSAAGMVMVTMALIWLFATSPMKKLPPSVVMRVAAPLSEI